MAMTGKSKKLRRMCCELIQLPFPLDNSISWLKMDFDRQKCSVLIEFFAMKLWTLHIWPSSIKLKVLLPSAIFLWLMLLGFLLSSSENAVYFYLGFWNWLTMFRHWESSFQAHLQSVYRAIHGDLRFPSEVEQMGWNWKLGIVPSRNALADGFARRCECCRIWFVTWTVRVWSEWFSLKFLFQSNNDSLRHSRHSQIVWSQNRFG